MFLTYLDIFYYIEYILNVRTLNIMNRKEQKEKRRKEILAVGLDLFVRKGYAATKTQDISQEAGMSEGLLFHYFASK